MTNKEKIQGEGYIVLFLKRPPKTIAIARQGGGSLTLTAQGKDKAQALSRLKTVVMQHKKEN